jgi:uncharacterized damage-inducible protein DinB
MLDLILRQFAYDTWANLRMIDSVHSLEEPSDKIVGLVAHLFSSKRMWLGRIQGTEDATISTWPLLGLDESEALALRMFNEWEHYLHSLTDEQLAETIQYHIRDVGPGMQTVSDIISHKFLHAAYHRGQIAMLVRQEGGTPASTDLVVWAKSVREGNA